MAVVEGLCAVVGAISMIAWNIIITEKHRQEKRRRSASSTNVAPDEEGTATAIQIPSRSGVEVGATLSSSSSSSSIADRLHLEQDCYEEQGTITHSENVMSPARKRIAGETSCDAEVATPNAEARSASITSPPPSPPPLEVAPVCGDELLSDGVEAGRSIGCGDGPHESSDNATLNPSPSPPAQPRAGPRSAESCRESPSGLARLPPLPPRPETEFHELVMIRDAPALSPPRQKLPKLLEDFDTSTDTAENSSPASGDQEPAGCDLSPDFHLSAPWSPIRRKGVLKSHSFGNRPRTFSEYSAGPSCCHLGSGVGGDGCVAGSCEHTRARSASVLERPVGGGDDFCRVLGGGGDASCADSDPFAEFRHAAAPLIEDDDWTPSTSRESFPREKRNNVAAVGSRDSRGSSRAGDMVGANMKGGGADGGGTRRRRNTGGDSMVRLLERERLYPHGRDVLPVSWLA